MEQAQSVRGPDPVAFCFTGSGSEDFRIWITNLLLFFLFLPWLVVRAMTFRLRNNSYRNIRFDVARNCRGAS